MKINGKHVHSQDVVRFWSYVHRTSPNNCWPWTRAVRRPDKSSNGGYGRFWCNDRTMRAHRFAFLLEHGYLPKQVLHTCDNPPCCNPAHLYDGSHADNMRDKAQRDRMARREGNGRAVLTSEQVDEVRALYATGAYRYVDLAARYRVVHSTIGRIVRHIYWK